MCMRTESGAHVCAHAERGAHVFVLAHRKVCTCVCACTQEGVCVHASKKACTCVFVHAERGARVCALKPERAVHMHAHVPGSVHTHVQPHQGLPHTCTHGRSSIHTPHAQRAGGHTHVCMHTREAAHMCKKTTHTHTHTHTRAWRRGARPCAHPHAREARLRAEEGCAHSRTCTRSWVGTGRARSRPGGGQQARQGHAAFDGERC